jgi:NADPH:quinone reductase-like Zn-dependent oxidoreductase
MVKNTRVGFDFAGEVVEGQDPFNKGAKVYGTMPPFQGSFAEYIRVPRHQIALAPTNISMDEAACLPLVGLTGWQALSPQVKPGQSSVLIVGGSGGTGHVAIQIANALGAKSVTVICSTRNIEFVKLCGATNVVDYAKENDIIEALQRQMVEPFDVILDCVSSGDPRDASYNYPERVQHASDPPLVAKNYLYLRLGGKWSDWIWAGLAHPGIFPHSWLWKDDQECMFWIKFRKSAPGLKELTTLVEDGKLKVRIQKVYPEMTVDTVQQAMDDLLLHRAQGKVAIRVSQREGAD